MRAGYIRGRHYSEYVGTVRALKKKGRATELERLLLQLVDATEAEARKQQSGVAPWYYEEAAKLYRKHKDFAREVEILERFARQRHGLGARNKTLLERLEKARALLVKHQGD